MKAQKSSPTSKFLKKNPRKFLRKVERWTSKERRLSDCLGFHVVDLFYGPTHSVLSPFLLGLVSVPDYPFEKNRAAFVFNTLLTKPEVITVLSTVREECNRVAKMSLFHVSFTKSLSLEEFESAESQKHTQVYKLYTYTCKCASVSSYALCLPSGSIVSTRVMAGHFMYWDFV